MHDGESTNPPPALGTVVILRETSCFDALVADDMAGLVEEAGHEVAGFAATGEEAVRETPRCARLRRDSGHLPSFQKPFSQDGPISVLTSGAKAHGVRRRIDPTRENGHG
jgi:hypothetical protein